MQDRHIFLEFSFKNEYLYHHSLCDNNHNNNKRLKKGAEKVGNWLCCLDKLVFAVA